MFDDQHRHRRLVEWLRRLRLPALIGGGVLDWYSWGLQWWAPVQDADTYFGARLRCDPVDSIQRMILLFGVWEPGISRVIEDNLQPGDVFVDVGANIGYDSLLAASCVGPDGKVVAIEASPSTLGLLRRNLDANPRLAERVRVVNVAVSDRAGELDLYEVGPKNVGGATTLPSRKGRRAVTVAAARLGDILTADEMARVRLIKMDVEGAEPAIVNDILDHLDAYPANMDIIIEANPQDERALFGRVFERLQAAGFAAWAVANGYSNGWYLRWQPKPLRPLEKSPRKRHDLLLTRRAR